MFTLIATTVYGIPRNLWECTLCGSHSVEEGTFTLTCRDCGEHGPY